MIVFFYGKAVSGKEQAEEPRNPAAGEVRRGCYKVGREGGAERRRKRDRAGESEISAVPSGALMRKNGEI